MILGTMNASAQETLTATHYGESYNGRGTYCGTTYWSMDTTIVALGPAFYSSHPCGTTVTIVGTVGTILATVQDRCGGCTYQVDLSEAGIIAVCGSLGSCQVEVTRE